LTIEIILTDTYLEGLGDPLIDLFEHKNIVQNVGVVDINVKFYFTLMFFGKGSVLRGSIKCIKDHMYTHTRARALVDSVSSFTADECKIVVT
jgi:hypothetical protein